MENRLEKYARLLVELGVNLQENQYLIVEAPADAYPLVRAITKIAFEKRARDVIVFYNDAYVDKERCEHVSETEIRTVLPWQKESRVHYLKEHACSLLIKSAYPYLYASIKETQSAALQAFTNDLRNNIRSFIASDGIQWCIAAYPNQLWAESLFPQESKEDALAKMYDVMYDICRVTFNNNPTEDWKNHFLNLGRYSSYLNSLCLDRLHFQNSLGTDITIGLHANHHWNGGMQPGEQINYIANIPTEEISTSPDKYRADGVVYASKPLELGGALIENFWLRYEAGKVVEVHAEKNQQLLEQIIATDAGSCHLGEVALVEYNSPISQSGLLFYNTLYDENASCHLALGKGFPSSVRDTPATDFAIWEKHHLNYSSVHVDFMFGTSDMTVTGYDTKGKEYPIFINGNFVGL